MQALRRSSFVRHVLIPMTLMGWLSGCVSWSTQRLPVDEYVTSEQPSKLRVTKSDGGVVLLESPEARNDSLVGWDVGETSQHLVQNMVAIPIEDITKIEVETPDSRGTFLAIGFPILLLFTVWYITFDPFEP